MKNLALIAFVIVFIKAVPSNRKSITDNILDDCVAVGRKCRGLCNAGFSIFFNFSSFFYMQT